MLSFLIRRKKLFAILFVLMILFGGKIFLNVYYPLKYLDIINEKSKKYDLEPSFICAIIRTESRFDKNAVSKKDAKGLMQIMKTTAEWGFDEIGMDINSYKNILNEDINIEIGCWYIKKLINQYDGDKNLALIAYNAGSGNLSKWLNDLRYSKDGKNIYYIPYKETRNYIKKVESNEKIYSILIKLNTR